MSSKSFDDIYNIYYKKAYLFVRSYVHDDTTAEDIVTEGMITLWMQLKNQELDNIQSFLFTILRNKALDLLRRQLTQQKLHKKIADTHQRDLEIRISSLQSSEYNTMLLNEMQDIISKTIQKMKPKTRQVFILSRYELLTNRDIAKKLQITTKGVEYHMSTALSMLRTSLKEYLSIIFVLLFLK